MYQRGLTSVNEILAKITGRAKALLNPTSPWMLIYLNGEVLSVSTDVSYLSVQSNTNQSFIVKAVSSDLDQSTCQVTFEVQPIANLMMVYPTLSTLKPSFTIPIKSSLVMPVGNYYEGLNLSYSASSEGSVKYNLRRANPTLLVSIYSRNPLLLMREIDESNFYRLTTDVNAINIEHCFDRSVNVLCTPVRTKKTNVPLLNIRLFDSATYRWLLTYQTEEDPYSIFIEDIAGKSIKRLRLY